MLRNILGVIAGFVLWSILWVGSDTILASLWSNYAKSLDDFNKGAEINTNILLFNLLRSVVVSFISGYVAALTAGHRTLATVFALGVLLFAFGVFVQASVWNTIPLWYHFLFLFLLIPITWLGGHFGRGLPNRV